MPASTTETIDYRLKYFPHESLTPVTGTPTYADIRRVQREALQNLIAVPTACKYPLGHVALGVSASHLLRLASRADNKTYTRPTDPGTFKSSAPDNEKVTEKEQADHDKKAELYADTNRLEKIVLQDIQKAFDPDILQCKTDRFFGYITCTIPEVFKYLLDTYGNVTATAVAEARTEIQNYQFDFNAPLDALWTRIHDFADLADARGVPETDTQLVELALIVIMKSNLFEQYVKEWNKKTTMSDKTWDKCQDFFSQAQQEIKNAKIDTTSASLGYSSANHVQDNTVPAAPPMDLTEADVQAAQQFFCQLAPPSSPPAIPQANQVSSTDPVVTQLLDKMKAIQAALDSKSSGDDDKDPKPKPRKNKKKGERKYCWTHGCCAHDGSECKNQGEGHKKEATFKNMMGGSDKNCFWAT